MNHENTSPKRVLALNNGMKKLNHKKSILIADDDDLIRIILRKALKNQGYAVIESINGKDCLETCIKFRPDLVLLDCTMPVMDGFTCCRYLRRLPNIDYVPIVMLTSLTNNISKEIAIELGVLEYIAKPFQLDLLVSKINQIIQ